LLNSLLFLNSAGATPLLPALILNPQGAFCCAFASCSGAIKTQSFGFTVWGRSATSIPRDEDSFLDPPPFSRDGHIPQYWYLSERALADSFFFSSVLLSGFGVQSRPEQVTHVLVYSRPFGLFMSTGSSRGLEDLLAYGVKALPFHSFFELRLRAESAFSSILLHRRTEATRGRTSVKPFFLPCRRLAFLERL